MNRFGGAVVAAAFMASSAAAQTVVIVRHAEKADESADPALSPAGVARAAALARSLEGAGVTAVVTTTLKRTRQTGGPAAAQAGVAMIAVPPGGGAGVHVGRVVAEVRRAPVQATVLVVGHSNTAPEIARALGDPKPELLADCDYDRMTVIQLGSGGAKAVHTRYGAPSASC